MTSSNQTSPLFEEEDPISKYIKVWKEQKYDHGSRRGPKPRMTVLARISSNLLDRLRCIKLGLHVRSQGANSLFFNVLFSFRECRYRNVMWSVVSALSWNINQFKDIEDSFFSK
jgi:hypothetical protein